MCHSYFYTRGAKRCYKSRRIVSSTGAEVITKTDEAEDDPQQPLTAATAFEASYLGAG